MAEEKEKPLQQPIVRKAKTYVGKMHSGKSKPLLFEATDGTQWVVKYKNNPQGIRILVNEWVASNLAQLLSLPSPECSLIMLDKQLLEIESTSIPGTTTKVEVGLSFGSRYIDNADNNPTRYQMDRLDNTGIIPGIIVMDTWIDNPDRDDRDRNFSNIIVSPSSIRSKYTLHLIDLGKVSSSHWTANELLNRKTALNLRGHNRLFAPLILGRPVFQPFLEVLESVSAEEIESVVATVPDEWNLSQEEAAVLVKFLKQRKNLVREIIESRFS